MMYNEDYYMGIHVGWWAFMVTLVILIIGLFYKARHRR